MERKKKNNNFYIEKENHKTLDKKNTQDNTRLSSRRGNPDQKWETKPGLSQQLDMLESCQFGKNKYSNHDRWYWAEQPLLERSHFKRKLKNDVFGEDSKVSLRTALRANWMRPVWTLGIWNINLVQFGRKAGFVWTRSGQIQEQLV